MRVRTKRFGLVTHATPDGKTKKGEAKILHEKFQKGTIDKEELRRLVNFTMIQRPIHSELNSKITVKFGGKTLTLTYSEYETYYVPAYGRIK